MNVLNATELFKMVNCMLREFHFNKKKEKDIARNL